MRRLEEDFEPVFARAAAALRERLERACADEERQMRARAEAEIARCQGVDAARLRALARWLALRVAGGEQP